MICYNFNQKNNAHCGTKQYKANPGKPTRTEKNCAIAAPCALDGCIQIGLLLLFLLLAITPNQTFGQGCVASPNNPCSHVVPGEFTNTASLGNRWLGSVDYRWFESFRHFVG